MKKPYTYRPKHSRLQLTFFKRFETSTNGYHNHTQAYEKTFMSFNDITGGYNFDVDGLGRLKVGCQYLTVTQSRHILKSIPS